MTPNTGHSFVSEMSGVVITSVKMREAHYVSVSEHNMHLNF